MFEKYFPNGMLIGEANEKITTIMDVKTEQESQALAVGIGFVLAVIIFSIFIFCTYAQNIRS